MAAILGYPRFRALLSNGEPAVGYVIRAFLAGTTTPVALYTSQDQSATHPITGAVLDGNGEAAIWLAPNIAYKLELLTDSAVSVWVLDKINTVEGGWFTTLTVTGVATFAGVINAAGQIISTVSTGTAPLSVQSTTKVANLNADLLDGKQWDAPDSIGTTTPAPGKFTSLEAVNSLVVNGNTIFKAQTEIQGANGERWISASITEEITLNTGGTTTDSAADLLPANSIIEMVVARVTDGILTATNWALGDAATAARFLTATTDLVAGTEKYGTNHMKGNVSTEAAGPTQSTAAKLRITTTGTPSAGKVRVTVFYRLFVAPTS